VTRGARNFLTVDVEEWFHICGVDDRLAFDRWSVLESRVEFTTDITLELLARRGIRGTFFVLGWIADRYPALVARIRDAGHEIGSHGWSHRRVYELDVSSFDEDLARATAALEAAGAPRPVGFRAPEWSINDRSLWALDVVARRGFRYDSSMTPLQLVGNPRYPRVPHRRDTAGGPLLEVPPLTTRRLGQRIPLGGGWGLRMSRPTAVAREITAHNRRGEPVTLFVHPWELDPDPPRIPLPWPLAFSHYFRLEGFAKRLNVILASAEFGPIGEWALASEET
jgi:polysaccharide deacetylase family protein (PEP-CTERM system associated)